MEMFETTPQVSELKLNVISKVESRTGKGRFSFVNKRIVCAADCHKIYVSSMQ